MRSAVYLGSVMHRRLAPRRHRFRYKAFWLLLDLDEIETLCAQLRFFSHNRFNLFSLDDRDHGDGSPTPLRDQIAAMLRGNGMALAEGRVRMLCMPRTLGFCFNPLTVYFCERADGTPLALVYQVHNTFRERHCYVLPASQASGAYRQACDKTFYVSPFLDMDMQYRFAVSAPAARLSVAIAAQRHGHTILAAGLLGKRHDISDAMLLHCFLRIPAITLKVIAAIHWQALRLWLKGVPLQPRTRERTTLALPGAAGESA